MKNTHWQSIKNDQVGGQQPSQCVKRPQQYGVWSENFCLCDKVLRRATHYPARTEGENAQDQYRVSSTRRIEQGVHRRHLKPYTCFALVSSALTAPAIAWGSDTDLQGPSAMFGLSLFAIGLAILIIMLVAIKQDRERERRRRSHTRQGNSNTATGNDYSASFPRQSFSQQSIDDCSSRDTSNSYQSSSNYGSVGGSDSGGGCD